MKKLTDEFGASNPVKFYETLANFLYQVSYKNTRDSVISDRRILDLLFDALTSYAENPNEDIQFELVVPVFSYLVQSKNQEDLQKYLVGFRRIFAATSSEKLRNLADIKSLKAISNGWANQH